MQPLSREERALSDVIYLRYCEIFKGSLRPLCVCYVKTTLLIPTDALNTEVVSKKISADYEKENISRCVSQSVFMKY